MFKLKTTAMHSHQARSLNRRVSPLASAIALVMLLTGNVSGVQLVREDEEGALVTPRLNRPVAEVQLRLKLATHAGRFVLERG